MSDTAAQLVDRVFPEVPVRQWVLSLPRPLRFVFAKDSVLLAEGLRIFVQEVFRHYRRISGIRPSRSALPAGVTAIQRYGSSLNLMKRS
jgi:hypothetical protein